MRLPCEVFDPDLESPHDRREYSAFPNHNLPSISLSALFPALSTGRKARTAAGSPLVCSIPLSWNPRRGPY
ncbi:unnamed protein product [Urochloa humidicola]